MIKNEVKIYDSKIELPSAATATAAATMAASDDNNSTTSLPLIKIDLANGFVKSGGQIQRFGRKRKQKRTKSSGIF